MRPSEQYSKDSPGAGWESITGPYTALTRLDTQQHAKRRKRRLLQNKTLKPLAYRVDAENGARYKLLRFATDTKKQQFARRYSLATNALKTAVPARQVNFLPNLLWDDQNSVLLEWVEGRPAVLGQPEVSRQLGGCLAALHSERISPYPIVQYWAFFLLNVQRLLQRRKIAVRDALRLSGLAIQHLPRRLPRAIDLRDIKTENLVVDASGVLRLIDLGCLSTAWPLGQEIIGTPTREEVDVAALRLGYLQAGGEQFMWRQIKGLHLFHSVLRAARAATQLSTARDETLQQDLANKLQERLRILKQSIDRL